MNRKSDTLAIIRHLPAGISSQAVASAYGVSLDYVERNRPKTGPRRVLPIGFTDEAPIALDTNHASRMKAGSQMLLERMKEVHPERFG